MGIFKFVVQEAIKSHTAAKVAKINAGAKVAGPMKHLDKTTVTKGDVDRVGVDVQQLRSDTHAGFADIHEQLEQQHVLMLDQINEMHQTFLQHSEGVKQLVELVLRMHGLTD